MRDRSAGRTGDTATAAAAARTDSPTRGRNRNLKRLAVPIFLMLVIAMFAVTASRALPGLPILTQPRIAEMPLRRMFSTVLYNNYQTRTRFLDAYTTSNFMDKLRGMLAVERMAARTLAMRPLGSVPWYHRSIAALKGGRASAAREFGLRSLRDGPFTRGYAADRVAVAVRYWDDLTEAEHVRAYAYMRKMVYYTDSILVAQAAQDQPGVEEHLWAAVSGDASLEKRLGIRLRNGRHHLFNRK